MVVIFFRIGRTSPNWLNIVEKLEAVSVHKIAKGIVRVKPQISNVWFRVFMMEVLQQKWLYCIMKQKYDCFKIVQICFFGKGPFINYVAQKFEIYPPPLSKTFFTLLYFFASPEIFLAVCHSCATVRYVDPLTNWKDIIIQNEYIEPPL